ncbi:MAG: hypothetical protein ACOY5V_18505 [Pseudomonadota bacterium]
MDIVADMLVSRFAPMTDVPLLRVGIFGESPNHLTETLLTNLHRPPTASERRNPAHMFSVLRTALRETGCKALLLEEVQTVVLRGEARIRSKFKYWLRDIWNNSPEDVRNWSGNGRGASGDKMLIVVTGTMPLLEAFQSDAELKSRYCRVVQGHSPTLFPADSGRAFRAVARELALRHALTGLDVNDNFLIAYLFACCDGNLRTLDRHLQRAATLRKRNEGAAILDLLKQSAPVDLSEEDIHRRLNSARSDAARGSGRL